MNIRKDGISMIVVLWTVTILTVLTTVTVLMTTSDITSTVNLAKRKATIKSAEAMSEYVMSFIPLVDTLRIFDTLVNDTFIEEGDTIYAHSMVFSSDSTDVGSITHIPLITMRGTTQDPTDTTTVNPIIGADIMTLDYHVRGLINQDGDYLAQRKICATGSFYSKNMGHTLY